MIKSSLFFFVNLDENHLLQLSRKDTLPLWLFFESHSVEQSCALIASTRMNPTVLAAGSSMPDGEVLTFLPGFYYVTKDCTSHPSAIGVFV